MKQVCIFLFGSVLGLLSHADLCHQLLPTEKSEKRKVDWKFNQPTSLPRVLANPLDANGLAAFDEVTLNVLTGEVNFAKPVAIQKILQSDLVFDQAVVELGSDKKPHRIRWIGDQSGGTNFGRVYESTGLSANEIRMNGQGKVEALRGLQPHPFLGPSGQTMNEVLIESAWDSSLFKSKLEFTWNLVADDFRRSFQPFYGDYRFEYDKRGEVSAFTYAVTGTQKLFDFGGDQSWGLLNQVRVTVERQKGSVTLLIDNPGKYSSLLEMNGVMEKVGEIAGRAEKNLSRPLVDTSQLTSEWELPVRDVYRRASQEMGTPSEEYRQMTVASILLGALNDPKIRKEINQRLELVRANPLPSVTQIVFPTGREDLLIVTETYSRQGQSAERITQFQYRKQKQDFLVTGTAFKTQDGKTEKVGEDLKLILKPEYVAGYPGEEKKWVVGALVDPASQKTLTLKDHEKEFKARLVQINLGYRFTRESDWSALNLSQMLFHKVDDFLIGSALDNMLSGRPVGTLSLLKPYRRLELNRLLSDNGSPIRRDIGLQKSRFFSVQDVQDLRHQKDTPGVQALRRFIASNPETDDLSSVLQLLEKQVNLKQIETMAPDAVLRLVPYFREFSTEEIFPLLSVYFQADIQPLVMHLGGKRDVAREALKEQLLAQGYGKYLEIASQPPEIVVHHLFGSGVIYYVISSKVRQEFGTHFRHELKGLQTLLGTKDLASTTDKILQLYPGLAPYKNLSWEELTQLQVILPGMPNLNSSIKLFRELPPNLRSAK